MRPSTSTHSSLPASLSLRRLLCTIQSPARKSKSCKPLRSSVGAWTGVSCDAELTSTAIAPRQSVHTTRRANCIGRSFLSSLFHILDLLPHLLDQHLQFHRLPRRLHVLRLRRQRVRLAVELLHQEVELAADGFVGRERRGELLDMAPEPVELLRDVHLLHQQRDLLLEPVGVRFRAERGEPLLHPRADA